MANEEWDGKLKIIDQHGEGLTDWEKSFIDVDFLSNAYWKKFPGQQYYSPKQKKIIERIFEQRVPLEFQ